MLTPVISSLEYFGGVGGNPRAQRVSSVPVSKRSLSALVSDADPHTSLRFGSTSNLSKMRKRSTLVTNYLGSLHLEKIKKKERSFYIKSSSTQMNSRNLS